MKNLKLIIAAVATLTALGGTSLAQAQSADAQQQPQAQAQQHNMRHRHMTPNNNGCTGPVSFCNTYFGN
jgi:hypothetical protein